MSLDSWSTRFGHVQARFDELGATRWRRGRAKSWPAWAFRKSQMDGDVGQSLGGWKMRVALARILLMSPNVMLLDEPSNHSTRVDSSGWKGFSGISDGAC